MTKGHDKGHKGQMSDREVMQLALEALNRSDYLGWQLNIPIIKALRERLAQPEQEHDDLIGDAQDKLIAEQEPVAWISDSPTKGNGKQLHWTKAEAWRWSSNITPLYTAPVHPIDTSEKRVDETAKDEHEPDAYGDGNVYRGQRSKDSETKTLHYTEPLRNSWFKLTDAEVWDEWVRAVDESNRSNRELAFRFARAIEAKLRDKNGF